MLILLLIALVAQSFKTITIPRRNFPLSSINDQSVDESTLGAPYSRKENGIFTTPSGVTVDCIVEEIPDGAKEVNRIIDLIDDQHGVLLTSSYEYPGLCILQ